MSKKQSTYQTTKTFGILTYALKNYEEVICQGGKGSSKTTSAMQLIAILMTLPIKESENGFISVVSDTWTNLKKVCYEPFKKIIADYGWSNDFKWNGQDKTFTHLKTGKQLDFFGAANDGVGLGARRDLLVIDECNKINYETYLALSGRSKKVIMTYNPKSEFWAHTEQLVKRKTRKTCFFISNYEDNPFLPQGEINQLLDYKERAYKDPNIKDEVLLNAKENIKSKYYLNKWLVFGKGKLGVQEGLIFTKYQDWDEITEVPKGAEYLGAGLDFGFSHVTALVKIYRKDRNVYLKQVLFKEGLTAVKIANEIMKLNDKELLSSVIICDSSRPEVISELANGKHRIPAKSHKKWHVEEGLDLMHSHNLFVTSDSEDLMFELNSYAYATSRDGRSLGVPDKAKDVDNGIDAARYAMEYFLGSRSKKQIRGARRLV